MIVTVTPNPAIDVTIRPDAVVSGATHVVPAADRRAGGKGLNVARVLAQLGHDHTAVAPVGADEAAWFREDLRGVDARIVPCAGATRCTYAVTPRTTGATIIFNERGSARDDADWRALIDAVETALSSADVLAICGSLPPGTPDGLLAELIRRGRDAGAAVIADTSGAALRAAADAGADVVKPNRDELRDATGEAGPVAGARALQRRGAGTVFVSLGADGLLAVPADPDAPARHASLGRDLAGNPTGAGDAAVAAIAAGIAADRGALGPGLDDLLRRATAWSAAAVLAPLAGSLDPSYAELVGEVTTGEVTAEW